MLAENELKQLEELRFWNKVAVTLYFSSAIMLLGTWIAVSVRLAIKKKMGWNWGLLSEAMKTWTMRCVCLLFAAMNLVVPVWYFFIRS